MSLFNLFKKKKTDVNKCVKCFKDVGTTEYWKIAGKQYCRECYTKETTLLNAIDKHADEKADFEMYIENIFSVKDVGVILTGTVKRGFVEIGSSIEINDNVYSVKKIDILQKGSVPLAQAGENAGLLISTLDPSQFKIGDRICNWKYQTLPSDTFVCNGCKRQMTRKYLHKSNMCLECYQAMEKENKAKKNATVSDKSPTHLNLGNFSIGEDEHRNMAKAAIKYLPANLNESETHIDMLKSLSCVMDVTVIIHIFEYEYSKIRSEKSPELKERRFMSLVGYTGSLIDKGLASSNPEYLKSMVSKASCEQLLKSWIVLDFYANLLKSEYSVNIQHFRNYIHTVILKNKSTSAPHISPVRCEGAKIYIDSHVFFSWKKSNPLEPQFEFNGVIHITEKEPLIEIYEDNSKTLEYRLETQEGEDFSGKFFHVSVRLGFLGNPAVPTMQVDGFISDTPDNRNMTTQDIGYRMEGHCLACGGELSKKRYEAMRGQDLVAKGLKYQGRITPSNIRLVGICPDCRKSFTFNGYAFYMAQSDVAYSDDGLDVCEIVRYDIDKDTWKYEENGKVFRYYNSFNCPHCGTPYIDYKKYPQMKNFGVSGCVLIGRKNYTEPV